MGRAKKAYEARDVAQAAGRMFRGLVKRAGTGDQEGLYELVQLQAKLTEAVNEAGARMYLHGYTYTAIGSELGISRQAARQRFQPIVDRLKAEAAQELVDDVEVTQ